MNCFVFFQACQTLCFCPYLQTFSLPFVPKTYDTVIRGTAGYHVVSICLDAVQRAIMRLLPLHCTLPVRKDERLNACWYERKIIIIKFVNIIICMTCKYKFVNWIYKSRIVVYSSCQILCLSQNMSKTRRTFRQAYWGVWVPTAFRSYVPFFKNDILLDFFTKPPSKRPLMSQPIKFSD